MEEHGYMWGKRHAILQRVEISVLYHQKRERFFDICDKTTKAVAIIGGSFAFANLAGPLGLKVTAAIITVTSTAALVLGFADRARRHSELASEFRRLDAEIAERGERDFAEGDLKAWEASQRRIESKEPAALGTLVLLCQNEIAVAQGHQDSVIHIPWYRRVLAHFIDFTPSLPTKHSVSRIPPE